MSHSEIDDPMRYLNSAATAKTEAELIAAAERRGEARILREIAKLPSPWKHLAFRCGHPCSSTGEYNEVRWTCDWCSAHTEDPISIDEWQSNGYKPTWMRRHPDNGCLWPRAQAAQEDQPAKQPAIVHAPECELSQRLQVEIRLGKRPSDRKVIYRDRPPATFRCTCGAAQEDQ